MARDLRGVQVGSSTWVRGPTTSENPYNLRGDFLLPGVRSNVHRPHGIGS